MARGVAPVRSRDPERIRQLVERDGAAILLGWGTTAEDALAAARAVFGPSLLAAPAASEVAPAGVRGRRRDAGQAHTDGWSLGDRYPDYVLLSCAARSGEVVVVDNYRMMHGSDPCPDRDRRWWRVRAWTTGAYGVPGRERSFDPRAVAS
jgi:hypothetical protein